MKKRFLTVLGVLFCSLFFSACAGFSDPVEEVGDFANEQVILQTEGADGDKGGPKGEG